MRQTDKDYNESKALLYLLSKDYFAYFLYPLNIKTRNIYISDRIINTNVL